jgi:hypothetical protein
MTAIFRGHIASRKKITHKDVKEIFDNEYEKSDDSSDDDTQN